MLIHARTAAGVLALFVVSQLTACATLAGPSSEIAGPSTLDTDALGRAARRNLIAGEVLLVAGGAIGLTSGALLITGAARTCPTERPACNDVIDVTSNYVGAASLLVTSVGIVFWALGYSQKRVVQKLRGQRKGP